MDLKKFDAAWFTDLVEQIISFLRTAINFIKDNALSSHYLFEEEAPAEEEE